MEVGVALALLALSGSTIIACGWVLSRLIGPFAYPAMAIIAAIAVWMEFAP